VKGSLRKKKIDIGISAFGTGNVQIRKHVQSEVQENLELNLSRAFLNKITQLPEEEWAHLNQDE
jgi:hypothetical protein